MDKDRKVTPSRATDDRLEKLSRLSDRLDQVEPEADSMFKFNIVVPYSDGAAIKPVLWNY